MRKLLLLVTSVVVALVVALYWVIGTEAGTRFLLARAPLPANLSIDDVRGSLLYGVRAGSIQWSADGISADLRDVDVNIGLRRLLSRHILIQSLTVGTADVRVAAKESDDTAAGGTPEFESEVDITLQSAALTDLRLQYGEVVRELDELRVAGALRGSKLSGLALALRSDWLDADITGTTRLSRELSADLTLDWQYKEGSPAPLSGRLRIRGDAQQYEIQHELTAPVVLATSGVVSYVDGAIGVDVDNKWEALEWPVGDNTLTSPAGTLRLAGSANQLTFDLAADAAVDASPLSRIVAQGSADTNGLRISNLVVSSTFGQLSAAGIASWAAAFELDVEYAGVFDERDVQGEGFVAFDGTNLRLERTVIRSGDNTLRVGGVVGDDIDITAQARIPEASAIVDIASGNLTISAEISGKRDDPEIRLLGEGSDLNWSGRSAEKLEFTVTGTLGEHTVVASIVAAAASTSFGLRGGFQQREWSGEINRLRVLQTPAGDWQLSAPTRAAVSPERMALSRFCLDRIEQDGQACAELDAVFGDYANFDIRFSRLPLTIFPVPIPPDVNVSGFVNASAKGSYAAGRIDAELDLDLQEARIDALIDDEPVSVVAERAVGSATIVENTMQAALALNLGDGVGTGSLQLTAKDVLDANAAIAGEGNVAIEDIVWFSVFVPQIANPRGTVRGNLAIGGTLAQPEFTGTLGLAGAAFDVRRAGIEVREIDIQLAQASPGRLRFDGSATSGDGHLTVAGETWISAATGIRSEVRLEGQDFELMRLPDWQVSASPSIVAIFDDRVTRVSGELVVPTADIQIREVPQSAVSPSPDTVVHRAADEQTSVRRRIEVDVRAALGDDVKFAAFGLSTGISGAVQLQGGTHQPFTGVGRLTLKGGRYKAYGQDLDIERGELIFSGPLDNPQLDVRATRSLPDVVAGIQLSGTPAQLRSDVFSEPTMAEAEALSYLLTGRPLASASGSGDGDRLNAAAFALGLTGAGAVASEIRAGLGLETLAIEGGVDDSRLIAGRRFGDRLLVEYGYGLVDKLGTLLLRYRLNDRVTLESRTGEVSNFDIVYSVKKK